MSKKLLIIGCGHSGTRYTALALRNTGLDIGHEMPRPDGMICWWLTPDEPMTVPLPHASGQGLIRQRDFDVVLHQVRHPLKVIKTQLREGHQYRQSSGWAIIERHCDVSRFAHPIRIWLTWWLHWNRIAEEKARWTYRVEDLKSVYPEICRAVGVMPRPELLEASRKTGSEEFTEYPMIEIGWPDLYRVEPVLTKQVQAMAERYGY